MVTPRIGKSMDWTRVTMMENVPKSTKTSIHRSGPADCYQYTISPILDMTALVFLYVGHVKTIC